MGGKPRGLNRKGFGVVTRAPQEPHRLETHWEYESEKILKNFDHDSWPVHFRLPGNAMRKHLLILVALCSLVAIHADVGAQVYQCGDVYTNAPTQGGGCVLVPGGKITIVPPKLSPSSDENGRLPRCPSSGYKDNCFGEVIDSGDRYVGEFKDNKASGIGTITAPDGRRYVGEFKDDEIHGTGTMTFPDGATHVGRWVKGFAEGRGTYTSASGEKYVGEFKGSKRDGPGVEYNADGSIRLSGVWRNGAFAGPAPPVVRPTPIARAPAPPAWKPPDSDRVDFVEKTPPVASVAPPPAIKRSGPSLVSTGTGFFVSTSGYLLTNNHVVDGCKHLVAISNGSQNFKVEFVASDTRNDLALLKSTVTGIAAPFRDGVAPLGEGITVFGFPLAGTLTVTGNLTTGSISALAGLGGDSTKYQVSAPIQPGNSGGAVLDESGLVVGVVESSLNAGRLFNIAGNLPQNVNFAIKASIAQRFLQTHGVAYVEQPPTTTSRKASAIAEDAVRFTVLVACFK